MPNDSTIISGIPDFDIDDLIDSGKITKIKYLCADYQINNSNDSLGLDILGIYCLHTGRLIGRLNDEAIWAMSHAIDIINDSDDEIISEVLARTMLACRPSPVWTIQTTEVLRKLITRDPVGACVFYLTRAYHQNNKHCMAKAKGGGFYPHGWINKYAQADWNWERVRLNQTLHIHYSKKELIQLAELLLEVDAKIGIHTITTPTYELSFDSPTKLIALMTKHYTAAIKIQEEKEIRFQRDGGTQSRQVFQHYVSPYRKPTQQMVKAAEKQKRHEEIGNAMFAMMQAHESGADVDTPAIAVPVQANKLAVGAVFSFGGK